MGEDESEAGDVGTGYVDVWVVGAGVAAGVAAAGDVAFLLRWWR